MEKRRARLDSVFDDDGVVKDNVKPFGGDGHIGQCFIDGGERTDVIVPAPEGVGDFASEELVGFIHVLVWF